MARQQRKDNILVGAAHILEGILETNAPPDVQRQALFELALVMQDDGQAAKAQQIWAQYLHLYSSDPSVPDVLLRQGQLYRKMGVNGFAVSKFYAVMSSALKLKQDNLPYYKEVVVQAQTEIADTYYLDGKFEEAADFFNRILNSGDAEANREQLEWKLIRSLSYLTNQSDTIAKAQSFLTRFPHSPNLPEVRFLLAAALQHNGRNADALQQVLLLLQTQQENGSKDPEAWAYWQRRAGNEIANQLYKEGDYVDALEIYLSLAELDPSPAWQAPVWYQAGMAYEQLAAVAKGHRHLHAHPGPPKGDRPNQHHPGAGLAAGDGAVAQGLHRLDAKSQLERAGLAYAGRHQRAALWNRAEIELTIHNPPFP